MWYCVVGFEAQYFFDCRLFYVFVKGLFYVISDRIVCSVHSISVSQLSGQIQMSGIRQLFNVGKFMYSCLCKGNILALKSLPPFVTQTKNVFKKSLYFKVFQM